MSKVVNEDRRRSFVASVLPAVVIVAGDCCVVVVVCTVVVSLPGGVLLALVLFLEFIVINLVKPEKPENACGQKPLHVRKFENTCGLTRLVAPCSFKILHGLVHVKMKT